MSDINEINTSTKFAALIVATGFISCFGSKLHYSSTPISNIEIDNELDNSTEVMYDVDNGYMHMPNGDKLKIITNDALVDKTNHYITTK